MTAITDAHWPHLNDDWDERNHFLRTAFYPQAIMDAADARQDGRLQINEVNLGSYQARHAFWQRLKEIVDAHPEQEMMHLSPQGQEDTNLPDPDNEAQEPWDHSLQWEVFEYALAPMRTTQHPRATTDPMCYRAFRVDTPGGTVTFWDDGNGWTSVMEVDLPAEEAQTLRTRAQEFLAQHPTEHLRQA